MSTLEKAGRPVPKQIVIFRALQLGDMLNAVPAFRALRMAFPDARITLVGLPWSTAFGERFHHYLDDFILFPGFPGLPEQPPNAAQFPSFLRWMQAMEIDLALQMQGSGDLSNSIVSLWGAKRYAGFYLGEILSRPGAFPGIPGDGAGDLASPASHGVSRIPLRGDHLEFPLFEKDWDEFHQIRNSFGLQREFVCFHPGARKKERRWPPRPTRFGWGTAASPVLHGERLYIVSDNEEES